MHRRARHELIGFAVLAALWASAPVALAQLPWVHPIFSTAAVSPCDTSFHTGQTTTWNPSDKNGSITLSNSDFTAEYSVTLTQVAVRATPSIPAKHTGKWYYVAHVDAGSTNEWVLGFANGGSSLSQYPGNTTTSVGCYTGNWITQYPGPAQNFTGALPFGFWVIIAGDFDNNLGWCGQANAACVVDATKWSGTPSLNGNPATGANGINIAGINDGVSIMPAWGGFSASGTPKVTLFTNTPMSGATLAGFKYWEQP